MVRHTSIGPAGALTARGAVDVLFNLLIAIGLAVTHPLYISVGARLLIAIHQRHGHLHMGIHQHSLAAGQLFNLLIAIWLSVKHPLYISVGAGLLITIHQHRGHPHMRIHQDYLAADSLCRQGMAAPFEAREISYEVWTHTLIAGGESARAVTNCHIRHKCQQ